MPNTQILGYAEGETNDTPKKFKNIDTESFEFTWNGIPFGGSFPERIKSWKEELVERDLAGNPRRNDRGEVISRTITRYEILKPIASGELVIMPKYLVNFAAMHLARRMIKRVLMQNVPEASREAGLYKIRDAKIEMELQQKMVADNFEQTPHPTEMATPPQPIEIKPPEQTPTIPTEEKKEEETKKLEEVSWKCEICGFIAKNKVGLLAHKRFRHK